LANGSEAKKKPLTEGARGKRVISGMRPTGRLHIGHYFGALQNWVRLQSDPSYDCFYFIADWHALTSDYAETSAVAQNTLEIMIDYLAAGLDPQTSVIFQQSQVPEHAELHLLLSMVTPLGWLERVPTYKEALENVKDKDLHTYGFLGYPVLQTADIVIYGKEHTSLLVPVGEDQVSHVELTREIVRRSNFHWGLKIDVRALQAAIAHGRVRPEMALVGTGPLDVRIVSKLGNNQALDKEELQEFEAKIRNRVNEIGIDNFHKDWDAKLQRFAGKHEFCSRDYVRSDEILVEPEAMLTQTPRIPGLDGRKMSKSYGNTITLSESDADIRAKTKVMVTDPARKRRSDPGNPDVCPVYDWHKLFSPPETLKWSAEGCRTAGIGCIECKAAMADNLIKWIAPIRERRVEYEKNPRRVLELIDDGSKRARIEAVKTMTRVREAVFGWEEKRKEISGGGTAAKA
jgi:tryptophanyl-tRNA synthetase